MRHLLCAQMLTCAALAAQTDRVGEAVQAMQQGDLQGAESLLQKQLASEPRNGAALSVLGIVLDQEHRYSDADAVYKRALAVDDGEPSLLNNYGNHLLAGGHRAAAKNAFERAVTADPKNRNANMQLAKMAVEAGHGSEALAYLNHLALEDRSVPELDMLTGMALSSARRYTEAEERFQRAAAAQPDHFEVQYALGLAASKAGHPEIAERALQRAVELKPDDGDAIYDLAVVDLKQGKGVEAVQLLARGSAAQPQRADIQLLLAQSASRLGYFEDSIRAWDRYLALKPEDESAKREQAFAQSAIGRGTEQAVADLTAFANKHPNDAVGHYELGTALSVSDPRRATEELSKALRVDPTLTAAYVARGLLEYRGGETESALRDFAAAVKQSPENARILDRLGETYLATGRTDDALAVLKKASRIAPEDPSVLLHLGRALTKSGQHEAAAVVFARYRTVQKSAADGAHEGGLIEFLSLPPGEQQARYRAGVERTVAAQPGNAEAQVRYLAILLSDGNRAEAMQVCEKVLQLRPEGEQLAAAGRALIEAGLYPEAETFLDKSIKWSGSLPALEVELARARLYTAGPQAALAEMNRVDQGARTERYYAARAEMAGALGSIRGSSRP